MSTLELSGMTTILSILAIVVFTIGLIQLLKLYFRKNTDGNLRELNPNSNQHLITRTKYDNVNALSWSKPLFFFGLASALSTTILAFSWTTYEQQVIHEFEFEEIIDMEITPPPTDIKPPPPPPPPLPIIEEVEPEEIEEDEQPEFEDTDINVDDVVIEEPPVIKKTTPPPPPPPPVEDSEPAIRLFAENMPMFPGCEDFDGSKEEKKKCSEKLMMKYIYDNLRYPTIAKENGITGRVVLRFVVDEKGGVNDIQILRDINGGCGKAAAKVIESMNNLPKKWTPGKQNGRPVKVMYTLPITFSLK